MSCMLYPRFHSFFDDVFDRGVAPYWLNSGDNFNIANTTQEIINDEKKFGISLDVSQFKPEELKVNLDGRVLTIEGTHERKDRHNYMQKSFLRRWTVPEDVDFSALRSNLTDKGHLHIEAPKAGIIATRAIPIERK